MGSIHCVQSINENMFIFLRGKQFLELEILIFMKVEPSLELKYKPFK